MYSQQKMITKNNQILLSKKASLCRKDYTSVRQACIYFVHITYHFNTIDENITYWFYLKSSTVTGALHCCECLRHTCVSWYRVVVLLDGLQLDSCLFIVRFLICIRYANLFQMPITVLYVIQLYCSYWSYENVREMYIKAHGCNEWEARTSGSSRRISGNGRTSVYFRISCMCQSLITAAVALAAQQPLHGFMTDSSVALAGNWVPFGSIFEQPLAWTNQRVQASQKSRLSG